MKITLLPHALERMKQREISEEEVRDVLGRTVAERSPSEAGRPLALRVIYNRGLEDERIVVTVELGRPTNPREGGG